MKVPVSRYISVFVLSLTVQFTSTYAQEVTDTLTADVPTGYDSDLTDGGLRIPDDPPVLDDDLLLLDRVHEPDRTSADTAPLGGPATTFSVSGLGAATYSIPIEVPKGINGMEPGLSLVYDSQGGNNVAGWGFGLSCMSAITFVPKDIHHDSIAKPLHYDFSDSLALDGKRLIRKSGTHGVSGAVYTPEGDPYTSVKLQTDTGTGKLYFLVEAPDGMRYYYGRGSSLYTLTINGTEHYVGWYLSAYADRHGTSWSCTYTHTGNGMLLNGIYYDDKVVSILYENRPNDPQTFYVGNVQVTRDKRVKTIRVKKLSTGEIYRNYTFSYDTTSDQSGTKYSRLVSVTESNGSGETRKPVLIEWNNLPGFGMASSEVPREKINYFNLSDDVTGRFYSAADLNNDGISDLIYLYQGKDTAQGNNRDYTFVYVFLSNVTGGNIEYGNKRIFRTEPGFSINKKKGYVSGITPTDIDGDGLCDLCLTNVDKLGNGLNITQYTIITGERIRTSSNDSINPQTSVHNYYTGDAPLLSMSDYDHDGRTEIFHLETGKTSGMYKAYYLTNTDASILGASELAVTLPSKPEHVFSGDYNNDGLADVAVFCQTGYKVFFNQGTAHGTCPFSDSSSYTGTDISYRKRMIPGDFNGDGLPDFLMNGKESHNYYIVSCNGNGTFTQSAAIQLGFYEQETGRDDNRMSMIPLNLDHDEKTDFLLGKANFEHHGGFSNTDEYTYTEFRWYRSTGSGFELVRRTKTTNIEDARPSFLFTGDFSGNGQTELMNYGGNIYSTTMTMSSTGQTGLVLEDTDFLTDMERTLRSQESVADSIPKPNVSVPEENALMASTSSPYDIFHLYRQTSMSAGIGRMKKATDSYGNVSTPTYAYLTNGGVYTAQTDASYPVNDLTVPLSVVSQYTESGGAAGTMTKSLTYGDLKGHVTGKGLLGFHHTTLHDHNTGSVTQTTLSGLCAPYYEPTHKSVTTTVGDLSTTTDETYTVSSANGNHWTHLAATISTDIYGNETSTQYTYNTENGTLTHEYTEYDGDTNMTREKTYHYTLKGGAYRPDQVMSLERHPDSPGETWQMKQTSTYNNYGELTSTTENANTSLPRTTTYTYDTKGNVLTKIEQTGASTYLTTSYTYGDYRTLTSTTTSPASSTHTYTYDLWSRPLSHTETYGDTILTTVNTYDGWGNLSGTVSPDGVSTTYTRGWGNSADKKYYVVEERQGAPWVKTWYDSRGREVLTESVGPAYTHNDHYTYYDNKGQVVRRKEVEGNRTSADTLSYDILGRIVTERHTAGGNTTYSYGNRTVTSVTNGITLVKTLDAWGNVKQAMENGTVVSYSYAPNGKPKSVTSCGHTVTLAYDEVGNRTSLTDPDAGTSTWEYDNNGRVTRHTDARGKVTQTWYDAFGNRQQESIDGVLTKYYYDTPRKHVVWETSNGRIRRAAFDIYGRLLSTATYILNSEGTIFKTYTYDSYGRVQKNNYTFGTNVNNVYDEYGYKTSMTVNGKTIWRQVDYTGRKEIYKTLNDSILNVRRYDNAGRLTKLGRRSLFVGQNLSERDSITYTYNALTGNLEEEKYYLMPESRVYSYDGLDRLVSTGKKSFNGTVTTIQQQTYGSDGNILSKTGVGGYTYGSQKPHAVTAVENTGGIISQTPQSVTYNAFGKVSHIESGGYALDIDYGSDRRRWRSTVTDSLDNIVRSIRYCEDEELVTMGDTTLVVQYFDGGIVYVRGKNSPQTSSRFYQITDDRLGSVLNLVDGKGNKPFTKGYDAWGKPGSWNYGWFTHGYTGHEMLPEFGLINMNGRMYDPVLGRFLSPDDYVQMPLSPQGFNRYTYCNNNPLKYTDPSGEIFGLGNILSAGMGFISEYLASAVFTGDWGWNSIKSGLFGAASSLITYNMGNGNSAINALTYKSMINSALTSFGSRILPTVNLYSSGPISLSVSPLLSFGEGGLTFGGNMVMSYNDGNFAGGFGFAKTNNYTGYSIFQSFKGKGFSFGVTSFSSYDFNDNHIGSQTVGTLSYLFANGSFSLSNDLFAERHEDRWRTSAAEFRYKHFAIGTSLLTNDGRLESGEPYDKIVINDNCHCDIIGKYKALGNGQVYLAPVWIGRVEGNQITRIGISSKYVHILTQNAVHKYLTHNKLYLNYNNLYKGLYSYRGTYQSYSLWNR